MSLQFVHSAVEQVDALVECAEERVFLFLHHAAYEFTLCHEFRISASHLAYEYRQELVDERLFLSEERVSVAHCTAQYASDYVSSLCVAWQLSVGNGERYCTQVVGHYAHSHVHLFCLSIFLSRET